jgi:hypothetical protein
MISADTMERANATAELTARARQLVHVVAAARRPVEDPT